MKILQGRRRNLKLQCEQLFFIVHLLKQRKATYRMSRTHKPSCFYILNYFFCLSFRVSEILLTVCSGFSTLAFLGCPSAYSHVLQTLTELLLKKIIKILP